MLCCANVCFRWNDLLYAFDRINWRVCERILSVPCLPCKGHSLVGWILGPLFCVCLDQKSGNVNISHYRRLSTQREHTQWTLLSLFSVSVCLSRTFPSIYPLFLFLCHTYSQSRLLFCGPKLAKNIVSIKIVGHRSEQLIEKIFHWLVTVWMKNKDEMFFFYLIINLIITIIVSG